MAQMRENMGDSLSPARVDPPLAEEGAGFLLRFSRGFRVHTLGTLPGNDE